MYNAMLDDKAALLRGASWASRGKLQHTSLTPLLCKHGMRRMLSSEQHKHTQWQHEQQNNALSNVLFFFSLLAVFFSMATFSVLLTLPALSAPNADTKALTT